MVPSASLQYKPHVRSVDVERAQIYLSRLWLAALADACRREMRGDGHYILDGLSLPNGHKSILCVNKILTGLTKIRS